MSIFILHLILLLHLQTSLPGEKPSLGAMLQQSSPVLEPTTAGGEAASRAASSVKPACTATTSPLNWLADLTSGNVNKENKGEHFLPFGVLEYLQRDWAAKIAVRARLGVLQHGKCSLLSSSYMASAREGSFLSSGNLSWNHFGKSGVVLRLRHYYWHSSHLLVSPCSSISPYPTVLPLSYKFLSMTFCFASAYRV